MKEEFSVCEKCRPAFEKLRNRIVELEKHLAAYENPHTPYSRKVFKQKPKSSNGRKGRPKGYPGTTRPVPKPDRVVEKKLSRCPCCNKKLRLLYRESLIKEDIPKPQPIIVTEFIVNHYNCKNCGEIVSKPEECPDAGRFGNNVVAQCSIMKFDERLTFRKIRESLKRNYGLEITPASIMNMTRNVCRKLEPEHEELVNKIRSSPCVYADETSIRISGINHWIWIFAAKDCILCVVRKSRGKKVVKEILGDYKGIVVCDGWKSYAQFGFTIQRCWAHLLREADALENRKPYELLHALFVDAKNGLLSRTATEKQLRKIISRKYKDLKAVKLIQKIENGFDSWFTFMSYDVEPTNNTAEHALREHVVVRKIIGGLRSLEGSRVHEVMMSCFATWKIHGLNLFDTLLNRLMS